MKQPPQNVKKALFTHINEYTYWPQKKNKTSRIISAHNQPNNNQPTMMIHKQQGTKFYDKNPIHFLYRFFSMCIWIGMIWIINEFMISWVFVSIHSQKPIKITGNLFYLMFDLCHGCA